MAVRIINAAGVARIIAPGGVQRVTESLPVSNDNSRLVTFTGGDETSNIQGELDAAEAAGGGTVRLEAGRVYQVNTFTTGYTYRSTARRALAIGPGVKFDLNGSTIRAGNNTDMWILVTKNPLAGSPDEGIEVYNGTFDGNNANQSTTGTATEEEHGGLFVGNVAKSSFRDLTFVDCSFYSCQAHNTFEGTWFHNLRSYGCLGECYRFGVQDGNHCINTTISDLYSEDTPNGAMTKPNAQPTQGNAAIFNLLRCMVGKCVAINVGGGYKVDGCENSHFASFLFDGSVPTGQSDNGSNNCGVKFQGGSDALECRNISCGEIHSLNCFGEGLRLTEAEHITIGQYFGQNNARGTGGIIDDVRVEAGPHIIEQVYIIDSNATRGILLDDTTPRAPDLTVGSMHVKNPPAGMDCIESNASGARLMVGQIRVTGGANGIDVIDFNQMGLSRTNSCTINWGENQGDVFEGSTHDVGFFGNNWT